ncbi:MAG: hypothetical protein IPN29_07455 [Saprospiraceae bacterium]|nr:hypothetical protein [Saprospiraceae bacterium]
MRCGGLKMMHFDGKLKQYISGKNERRVFQYFFIQTKIDFIAIDEAHYVSMWGTIFVLIT